jgi:glutamine synthetase
VRFHGSPAAWGWVHTRQHLPFRVWNCRILAFGTTGDIVLMPDASTEVCIPIEDGVPEHFCLSDILTKDGDAWPYCPRSFLRRALQRLEKTAGCHILASFERTLS